MPKKHPPPSDELSRLLHTWKPQVTNDPQIATKVWTRIQADQRPRFTQQGRGLQAWLESLGQMLSRPAAASATIMAFAAIGAFAALLAQTEARNRQLDDLASEYVRSIDPVLMHPESGSQPTPIAPAHSHHP